MFNPQSRFKENLPQRIILICENTTNVGKLLLVHVTILHIHRSRGNHVTKPGTCEFPQAGHLMDVKSLPSLLARFTETLVGYRLYESVAVSNLE